MPVPKRVKKVAAELSNEDIALIGIDYVNKKSTIKDLDSYCKEVRKPLEAAIEKDGKVLDSGSKLLVLPHADVEVHLKQTLRIGKVLLPEAMDTLEENGLTEAIEKVPVIREDVIERLYSEGKITDELLTKIYAEKNNYAFSVSIKEKFNEEDL